MPNSDRIHAFFDFYLLWHHCLRMKRGSHGLRRQVEVYLKMLFSIIFFVFPQLILSLSFPNLQTKVSWRSFSGAIQTNTPFSVSANLSFPVWATANTFHPLAIDNPGPRPDLYSLSLSLYHSNGTFCKLPETLDQLIL